MTYINTSSKIENAIQNIVSNIFGIYKDSLYIDNIKNILIMNQINFMVIKL